MDEIFVVPCFVEQNSVRPNYGHSVFDLSTATLELEL